MASAAVLIVLLLVAAYTDIRWRRIPNRLTYSGIVLGLAVSSLASCVGMDREASESVLATRLGIVSWSDSWIGCFACGGIMLAGYVFFPGAIGGGDLKLLAMMGAFLGLHAGLESLLWTMVLSGCLAVVILIWQVGAWSLLGLIVRMIGALLTWRRPAVEHWPALQQDLFLSPSALAATLLVAANGWYHWW